MTQVKVRFSELHNALFLGGKNLGTKLDPGKLAGLKLVYDRTEKELIVDWQGEVGYVPYANVAVYVPGEPKKPTEQFTHPIVAGISSAQVSTPMGHVHAGPGQGKTGK